MNKNIINLLKNLSILFDLKLKKKQLSLTMFSKKERKQKKKEKNGSFID